ncbi:MAG: nucleotidyl transferase AbiEii/AbiGii toxin family protein [Candidatus Coatesbacteria bacterium]|nr:nucleotidyl transferase AbiEii/AbiGii toxin family protein [Candidatus Coatesbacteria bacterium]
MTGKEFLNSLANGKSDVLQLLLDILHETGSGYCVIGGLAVNAYVEPVVSLDIDVVVALEKVPEVVKAAADRELGVKRFEQSVNIASSSSDLRIQLHTDPRYQVFVARSEKMDVLGYEMRVASLEDVLQGKVWAYVDQTRRRSKRQKDLADIMRIIEAFPELAAGLPQSLQEQLGDT